MVTISIPKNIYKDFLDMLDSNQCQFTEEELKTMSPRQVELINYISGLVGEKATPRFKSIREQQKACRNCRVLKSQYP